MMRVILVTLSLLALAGCDRAGPASVQGRFYGIRAGENLFSIAEREYGNGLLWPEIRRFNPWVDPYQLQPGERIFIPQLDPKWGTGGRQASVAQPRWDPIFDAESTHRNPPAAAAEVETKPQRTSNAAPPTTFGSWNVISGVSSKTVFGTPLTRGVLFSFCGLLSHSFIQSILVWLATIFTFLKETSFKKSLKAVFLTETLTFATIVTMAALGVLMLYLASPEELERSERLFPMFEDYLSTNAGMVIAASCLLLVYAVLSIRFIPQILGVKVGQAIPVVILAILLPHMLVVYFAGQRFGVIPTF